MTRLPDDFWDMPSRLRLSEFLPAREGWQNRWYRLAEVAGTLAVAALILLVLWLAVVTVGAVHATTP